MTIAVADSGVRQALARYRSVDVLRGLVMAVMALDHTRDFVHAAAMTFQPEDLSRTTAAIFLTRWVTHVCAPVFMFTAGLGAALRLERGGTKSQLSRFLWTRGLWLVVLEFTVVRWGFLFNVDYRLVILLVFWALGLSMIALAMLVRLPYRALVAVSLGLIVLHNTLDRVRSTSFGQLAWVWKILHEPGAMSAAGSTILVAYPLVPWIGVMSLGFCFGRVYRLTPERRRTLLLRIGFAMCAAFVLLRAMNVYGDPRPWTRQSSVGFTVLSFLNCTKYPPSLAFLLMTLGPAVVFLGLADAIRSSDRHPLIAFGRTPLFYFVLHIPLIHALTIALGWLRYGPAPFILLPPPTLGTPRAIFPPDYGWSLGVVYALWLTVVVLLYPACLWFARLKQERRHWWLSYL
jgi:uncharacterized membrane protein